MPVGIIGIDIGTQGTKGALFTEDMRQVCAAFEPSRLKTQAGGAVWQEPADIYLSCAHVIKDLLAQSGYRPASIGAVGLDGQMAGILGIGPDGEATTYYDSWMDMRCGKYVGEMRARAGSRLTAITGGPFSNTHGPKILWWKRERPDAYRRTAKFVLPHGYVAGKMAGKGAEDATFDYTCLHFSGFGDNAKKEWSGELLSLFGIDPRKMARIVSPFTVVGGVCAGFAKLSGLAEGTPVVAGCGDTAAGAFGAGMFRPGSILDCAGTASVLCSVVDRYAPDVGRQTLAMMRSPVDGYWLPLAYINGGGLCVRWVRDLLGKAGPLTYDVLEAEAEKVAPGSEGLLFIPHLSGRVLPLNPRMRGSLTGLTFRHGRGHIYRAVMEGVAYEYAYFLSVLRQLHPGRPFRALTCIGGGSNSRLFNRIKANVLGLDVQTFQTGETALLGSAVIAAVGAGILTDYKKAIYDTMERKETFPFVPQTNRLYQAHLQVYLQTLAQLESVYEQPVFQD